MKPDITIEQLQIWADGIMNRAPDFVIGEPADMRRWWIIPRNPFSNVYLHEILRSDDDRALHDHPWANASLVIDGRYREITPDGTFLRRAGDYVSRPATALHRLELIDGEPCVSLFITGPKEREWGFDCPQGWVHWEDFTTGIDGALIGKGCGE